MAHEARKIAKDSPRDEDSPPTVDIPPTEAIPPTNNWRTLDQDIVFTTNSYYYVCGTTCCSAKEDPNLAVSKDSIAFVPKFYDR